MILGEIVKCGYLTGTLVDIIDGRGYMLSNHRIFTFPLADMEPTGEIDIVNAVRGNVVCVDYKLYRIAKFFITGHTQMERPADVPISLPEIKFRCAPVMEFAMLRSVVTYEDKIGVVVADCGVLFGRSFQRIDPYKLTAYGLQTIACVGDIVEYQSRGYRVVDYTERGEAVIQRADGVKKEVLPGELSGLSSRLCLDIKRL